MSDILAVLALALGLSAVAWIAWKWHLKALGKQDHRFSRVIAVQTDELVDARLRASEAIRLKNEFMARISREIRTQLTSSIGLIDLALATSLTRDQKNYLQLSKTSEESLLTLLDDEVEVSKTELEGIELEHVPFRLRDCLRKVVSASPETITTEVADDVQDHLIGDPYRLRQILLAIVKHAVASLSKGSIVISVQPEMSDAEPKEKASQSLVWTVQHHTGGIAPGKSIVHQLDPSMGLSSRKYGGSALGLEHCSKYITLMGGTIWQDTSGKQNRFSFTVQLERGLDPVRLVPLPMVTKSFPAKASSDIRVLVAEDNEINQVVVRRMLEKQGFQVIIANNGQAALAALAAYSIDLVLMDVNMPDMDGFEATRLIRADEEKSGAHIPIVAVTANALTGDRERCLRAGMDDYVSKPIQGRVLQQVMARLLSQSVEHPAEV